MAEFNTLDKETGVFQFGKKQVKKTELEVKKIHEQEQKEKGPKIVNVLENIPRGASHIIDGYFYKYGAHGFIYVWDFVTKSWRKYNGEIKELRNYHLL